MWFTYQVSTIIGKTWRRGERTGEEEIRGERVRAIVALTTVKVIKREWENNLKLITEITSVYCQNLTLCSNVYRWVSSKWRA